MTPAVWVQETAPDSKPGLASFWPAPPQPPPTGLMVQVNDVPQSGTTLFNSR